LLDLMATFVVEQVDMASIECAAGWHLCVPRSFEDALDIRLTDRVVDKKRIPTTTQGARFHFREGDTIYDTPKAYLPWDEALKHIKLGITIVQGTPAQSADKKENGARVAGTVIYDELIPNKARTCLDIGTRKAVSQDEFIRMLIVGP
jgi:hypothetical protein